MLSLPGEPQHLLGGEGEEVWRKNLLQERRPCSEMLRVEDSEKTGWELTGDEGMREGGGVRGPKAKAGKGVAIRCGA